ncbi:hypothetical protein AB4Y43_18780 [Paraburkholderia sp. BR10872]|uniref:hypothetical protein n=1 Tax=Paraburkholderia sp. BR10872 TaxID=3236989 RepID=UPI0034D2B718
MSKQQRPTNTELIERVTADAKAFFEAHPARNLYAGYLGNSDTGAWAYLVMERSGPYGAFEFSPPSDEFTREQFTTLLNHMPRGETIMKESADKVGGTVRAAADALLARALSVAPTSSTKH